VFNRFKGLFRDTWWLWAVFLVISFTFIVLVNKLFLVTLPVLVVAFVYYASMRYDDEGNHKGEEQEG
jgi:hypothetical protein